MKADARPDDHVTRAAMLQAALAYAARGWDIFPAPPGTKQSYYKAKESNGNAPWGKTRDADQIKKYWRARPKANIGLPTGAANGFWVLDADTPKGHDVDGIASLAKLEATNGALPETLMAESPSGSLHYYFQWPEGVMVTNSQSKIAPGIDIRGEGGMVLAPPSVKGASAYRWLNENTLIAAAPAWLLALVTADREPKPREKTNSEPLPDWLRALEGYGVQDFDDEDLAGPPSKVKFALKYIDPDIIEEDWFHIGCALYNTFGDEEGFAIWDEWSQRGKKYKADKMEAKWQHIVDHYYDYTAGTIFHHADEADEAWRDAYDDEQAKSKKQQDDDWRAYDAESKKQDDETKQDDPPKKPTSGITAEAYDFPAEETIARDDWLLGKHLLRGEVSGTAAMGGTGKSNLAIVEALAMASGKQLLHDTVAPARVVLINLEDKRNRMAKRIAAAMRQYKLTKEDIGDRLIVIARGEISIRVAFISKKGNLLRDDAIIEQLTNFMIEKEADVLSIDSFIRTHGINENDNSAIQKVVACFEDIASDAKCAVHLWHHSRKMGGEEATVEAARGAMAFIDACRSVRILETMQRKVWEDLKKLAPDMSAHRYYFQAFNGKSNFAPPSEEADWFQYVSVELNNKDPRFFDDEGDHVGVVTPWYYPHLKIPPITDADITRALEAIKVGGPWRADQRAKKEPWVGVPVAKALSMDLLDPRIRRAVVKLVSDWIAAGRLARATRPDQKGNQRDYIEVAP